MSIPRTLHHGLLKQAFHLAGRSKQRPAQADLRRSISASYYALFHLLVNEAIKSICVGKKDYAPLRHHLARTFQHANMKNVAQQFSKRQISEDLSSVFGTNTLDERLVLVASNFVLLQEARINADYNLSMNYFKHQALEYANMSQDSFSAWKKIHKTIQAYTFLIGLHNQKNINRGSNQ
ncbi:MAG: hypothetical protein OXF25_09805 [Cyanobacteria bacterium MAG CAR3_bin_5]|nr:hypothetical protein [Cyanobacteria bacterium MAG CAR3_bin_5]